MKKLFKVLAVMLVLTLIIGVIPASAATTDLSLKKSSKTLFLGGCKGAKASTGKKAPYYSYATLKKLVTNFDADTMIVRATSSDKTIVKTTTTRMKAVKMGTTTVTVKVYKGSVKAKNLIFTDDIKVTVKKNADDTTLKYDGITDGATFTTGDSVTISLPRGTSDTDARKLTCSDSNVKIVSAGTRVWKVTFEKAGSYTLTAAAYQSSTYNKPTASKNIKVTVEDPAPTFEIAQTTLNAFTISGVADTLTKADVSLYTKSGSTKLSKDSYVKSGDGFVVKDGVATITFASNFTPGETYYAEIDDQVLSFKAITTTLADVKEIKFATTSIKYSVPTLIELTYLNADGIDITSAVKSQITIGSNLELTQLDGLSEGYLDASSGKLIIYDANKAVTIKAVLTTGYDDKNSYAPITVSKAGSISAFEDSYIGEMIYTLVKDDGTYLKTTDKVVHSFPYGDTVCVEALFKFSDDTYRDFTEAGFTLISDTETVAMIGSKTATGGYQIIGINPGKATLQVFKGAVPVASFIVEVGQARVATSLEVVPKDNKNTLNLNYSASDSIIFTGAVKDQYGEVMDTAVLNVEEMPGVLAAVGSVSVGGFLGNILAINGYDVHLNTGVTEGTIMLKVTSPALPNVSKTIGFKVKDVAASGDIYNSSNLVFTVEGDSTIDATLLPGADTVTPTYVYATFTQNGYYVDEGLGNLLTSAPLPTGSYGLSDGVSDIFYTISFNGKIIDPSLYPCIYADSYNVEFMPYTSGSKLEKGTYTVALYKITGTSTFAKISSLGSKSITVVENTPDKGYVQKTNKGAGPIGVTIGNFFTFTYGGVTLDPSSIISIDYTVGNQTYIKNVTFQLFNSVYGYFNVTIDVGLLVTVE